MSTAPATAKNSRKAPKQDRSRATVDAILVATAHVLVERGYDKTTTNEVARRAGVSIGSLYQYFPNKEALVAALCEQHMQEVTQALVHGMVAVREQPLGTALRSVVKILLQHHAREPEVHRVFIEQVPRLSGFERLAEVDRFLVTAIYEDLRRRDERMRPRDLELAAFVLVHAVQAVTHAAVLERPHLLQDDALVDEIVDLVQRYLVAS